MKTASITLTLDRDGLETQLRVSYREPHFLVPTEVLPGSTELSCTAFDEAVAQVAAQAVAQLQQAHRLFEQALLGASYRESSAMRQQAAAALRDGFAATATEPKAA